MKWFLAFWLVLTSCFSVSLYANDAVLQQAYLSQQSDLQVQGFGQVSKVLPDENDGSRHQKFILKLNSGQTLLVAHNIDLAPRIPNLKVGDSVEFYGEYEWNKKGGVLHWTHKDPQNRHAHGWLKHNGQVYE
ncbi:putative lipoprotein [Vibrio cholerae]|nr:putative lipoprotein [Vibrio cholerae]